MLFAPAATAGVLTMTSVATATARLTAGPEQDLPVAASGVFDAATIIRRMHLNVEPVLSVFTFLSVSDDTMRRAQLWDCARCRAIVIDRAAHARWHVDGVAHRVDMTLDADEMAQHLDSSCADE